MGFDDESFALAVRSKSCVEDPKFDFMQKFELVQEIYNSDHTVDDLLAALSKSMTKNVPCDKHDKIMRDFVLNTIELKHEETKSSDIFEDMLNILKSKASANDNTQKKSKQYKTNANRDDVLLNADLMCGIYKFLDFKSVRQCSKVRKYWVKIAYQPASFHHVDTNDFIHYGEKNYTCDGPDTMDWHFTYVNFDRWSKIKHVYIEIWPYDRSEVIPQFVKSLKNIEKVTIRQNAEESIVTDDWADSRWDYEYEDCVLSLLENNKQSIKKLTLEVMDDKFEVLGPMKAILTEIKQAASTYLPELRSLMLKGMNDVVNIPSECIPSELKRMEWDNIVFSKEKFHSLLQNEKLMNNIEDFCVDLPDFDKTPGVSFSHLLSHLPNLRSLKLTEDENFTLSPALYSLISTPNCSKLKSLTVKLNSDFYRQGFKEFKSKRKHIRYSFNRLENLSIDAEGLDDFQLKNVLHCFKIKAVPIKNISSIDLPPSDCACPKSLDETEHITNDTGMTAQYVESNLKTLRIKSDVDCGRVSALLSESGAVSLREIRNIQIISASASVKDMKQKSVESYCSMLAEMTDNLVVPASACSTYIYFEQNFDMRSTPESQRHVFAKKLMTTMSLCKKYDVSCRISIVFPPKSGQNPLVTELKRNLGGKRSDVVIRNSRSSTSLFLTLRPC